MPTGIEWCDETWSPVAGCTPISEGCEHCWARRMANRLKGRYGYPEDEPFRVTLHEDRLVDPLNWKKPLRIFVSSMGDLFHRDVPFYWIDRVLATLMCVPQHTGLLLTKRPDRMLEYFTRLSENPGKILADAAGGVHGEDAWAFVGNYVDGWNNPQCRPDDNPTNGKVKRWPLPNIWTGTTVENQARANERIPTLLRIPAAVRFVSVEPMLGPVDLGLATPCDRNCNEFQNAECPGTTGLCMGEHRLDWVIAGCESGPKRRPSEMDWFRRLRDACQAAGAPYFLKQADLGSGLVKMPELDGRVYAEFPVVRSTK